MKLTLTTPECAQLLEVLLVCEKHAQLLSAIPVTAVDTTTSNAAFVLQKLTRVVSKLVAGATVS